MGKQESGTVLFIGKGMSVGHMRTHPYQSRELWHKVVPNVVPSIYIYIYIFFFSENYVRDTNF